MVHFMRFVSTCAILHTDTYIPTNDFVFCDRNINIHAVITDHINYIKHLLYITMNDHQDDF